MFEKPNSKFKINCKLLCNNIKYLRKFHRYTLKEVSEMIDIPISTLWNYENNLNIPTLEVVLNLNKVYRVNDVNKLIFKDMQKD